MFQLKLTTSAEIVEALPILMGYIPEERLVVSLQKESRVVVTASFDLEALNDVAAQTKELADLVARTEADHALAVVYSTAPHEHTPQACWLIEEAGVPALVLAATAQEWAPVDQEGYTGAYSPREQHNDAVLGAVVAGMQLPSLTREELARRYQPRADHVAYLRHAGAQEWNGETLEAITAPLFEEGGMDAHAVRSLAAALMVEEIWRGIFTGFSATDARIHLPILAAASTYYADTPATLREEQEAERLVVAAGFCAWLAGDGAALAVICGRLADRNGAGCIAFEEMALERAIVTTAYTLGLLPAAWLARKDES